VPDTIATALATGLGPGAGSYSKTTPIGDNAFGSKDVDLFKITGAEGSTLTALTSFPTNGQIADTVLRLFDASGNQLAVDDDSGGGVGGHYSKITYLFTTPGNQTYYVGVSTYSNFTYNPNLANSGTAGGLGDYLLSLSTTVAAPLIRAVNFVFDAGAPQRLTFDFSQDVSASLSTADFTLKDTTHGTTIPTASLAMSYNGPTNQAKLTFPGLPQGFLPDADYTVVVSAAGVTNGAGTPLPADVGYNFYFLDADANRDRIVNAQDFVLLALNFGGVGKTFTQGDFNYDGKVNALDFNALASRFGTILPSPGVEAPAVAVAPVPKLAAASKPASLFNDSARIDSLNEILSPS
jgi:hypothetical protein